MNTPKNVNPITVLDSLSPASQQALDRHFEAKYRTAILASITSQLGKKVVVSDAADETDEPATPKKRGPKAKVVVEAPAKNTGKGKKGKRGPGRPKLSAAEKARRAAEREAAKADVGPSGRAKAKKAAASTSAKTTKKGKRGGPGSLGLTARGLNASQVIRAYDEKHPDQQAAKVVEHCHKLGLTRVKPHHVYNVRQLVRNAQ